VCLGHQAIGQAYGGDVIRARQVMHGKLSAMFHNNAGVFCDLPSPFTATRYHSLVIDKTTLPECLEITAWTELENGALDEIMGVRHKTLDVQGVQFHPESILSEHGHQLFRNFLQGK
jgi:anthranilate synthase/aminodeoxychorismate synthase-like glutamine amidotransferase